MVEEIVVLQGGRRRQLEGDALGARGTRLRSRGKVVGGISRQDGHPGRGQSLAEQRWRGHQVGAELVHEARGLDGRLGQVEVDPEDQREVFVPA